MSKERDSETLVDRAAYGDRDAIDLLLERAGGRVRRGRSGRPV
jgi:hypothetical protein